MCLCASKLNVCAKCHCAGVRALKTFCLFIAACVPFFFFFLTPGALWRLRLFTVDLVPLGGVNAVRAFKPDFISTTLPPAARYLAATHTFSDPSYAPAAGSVPTTPSSPFTTIRSDRRPLPQKISLRLVLRRSQKRALCGSQMLKKTS